MLTNPEIIKLLEELLQRVKSGEITSIYVLGDPARHDADDGDKNE